MGREFKVVVGATPSRQVPEYWGGTIAWVSSGEVQFGRISSTRERIAEEGLRRSSTQVNPKGSVLLGMIGQGRTRGQAAILDIDAANNQNCAAIWVSAAGSSPEFVFYWLMHRYEKTRQEGSGNNQQALNKARVEAIPVPMPPPQVQLALVAEIERRLSIVREVEAEVDANLKRAQGLRQAVLMRAFAGDLIDQPSPVDVGVQLRLVPGTTNRCDSARVALSAEIVHRLHAHPTFGQVKHQKVFHLIEHIGRVDSLQVRYRRAGFGPLNMEVIARNEQVMRAQGWYAEQKVVGATRHEYVPLSKVGQHVPYLDTFSADQLAVARRLIDLMRDWSTEDCETFSTVYAAWNDVILFGREPTPDAVVREVLDLWDKSKQRIPKKVWLERIDWIKRNGYVPTGFGVPTRAAIDGTTGDMFGPSGED